MTKNDYTFIYGKPFDDFYELKFPEDLPNVCLDSDIEQLNNKFREDLKYVPKAVWQGSSVNINDVAKLIGKKVKRLNYV